MKQSVFLPALLLIAHASAQSSNLLGSLISEAISVFTSVTSELGQQTTSQSLLSATLTTSDSTALSSSFSLITASSGTPSRTATASSGTLTTTSSSSTQGTSSTSSTSNPSNTLNTSSTSQSGTAAATSATSAAAGGVSHHDRNLAIILGTVLGALALGLLILLLLLCCRRRRRRAAAGGRKSLSSRSSHEALATHKGASSHVTPRTGNSLYEHSTSAGRDDHVGMPLMSERSNYDVPSAHNFHQGATTPFVPTAMESKQPSGIVPTHTGNYAGKDHRLHNGTGLDNHPHQGHHTGSALAAGAGGAALGAAAARHHSRSSERNYKPRLSGDPDVHPSYWEDAPASQPLYPSSVDNSRRRSGSSPREVSHPQHDRRGSALRDGTSAAALGGVAGAVGGMGRRSHERGRSLASNPPPYSGHNNGFPSNTHGNTFNKSPARHSGIPSGATGPPQNRYYDDRNSRVPAAAAGAFDDRRRSHSGGPPPVPSLVTNGRRSIPSRSPKRTRFVDDPADHDPMPYEDDKLSNGGNSRPISGLSNHRNSAIRPTSDTDRVVSPILPQETNRRGSYGAPTSNHRANAANFPGHPQSLPTPPSSQSTTPSPVPTRPTRQRTNSGLVSAVQDHFNPNATPSPTIPNPPPVPHSSHTPYTAPSEPTTTTTTTTTTSGGSIIKPVSRKPVPQSSYNSIHPSTHPDVDSRRDSWWKGQEDSAWERSYSGKNSAADSHHHVGDDGAVNFGIGEAR